MDKYHICLVSDQPIPNLVPVLIERPAGVVLLVSPEKQNQAEWLRDVLKSHGIRVITREIAAYDFDPTLRVCEELLRQAKDAELELNVTGGTKVVALAAFHAFASTGHRIFYQNTADAEIIDLAPVAVRMPLSGNHLTVRDYLTAYGFTPLNDGTPPVRHAERLSFLPELARLLIESPELLGRFNRAIDRHRNPASYANIPLNDFGNQAERLFLLLERCKAATFSSREMLNIPSEQNLFFCQGGWLEEFVYQAVQSLELPDVKPLLNIEIAAGRPENPKSENEFDVLFTHRDRLHLISCKAARLEPFRGSDKPPEKGKEALYELDSLSADAGGLFGRAMLISARTVRPADRKRAATMDITVVDGPEVLRLHEHLRRWLRVDGNGRGR